MMMLFIWNWENIDEEVKKQAINVKAQLDHSKIYYKWLAQLSASILVSISRSHFLVKKLRKKVKKSFSAIKCCFRLEYDIVKQQFTRGSRKQHFIAEKDFFTFFRNFFTKF
jgi:DNA-binding transcriptional regulator GbsR (MarR family)